MTKRLSTVSGHQASKQRTRIRIRDNYTCRMCSRAVAVGNVDHIIALVNGGTDTDDNLQLLCIPCHDDKTRVDMGYTIKTGSTVDGLPTNPYHHWN